MTDTNRRSDATPALRLPIDRNKQVSWEQRRLDSVDAAGMTTFLDVPGKVSLETLTVKIRLRLAFGMRLGMHNMPAMGNHRAHCAASPIAKSSLQQARPPATFGSKPRYRSPNGGLGRAKVGHDQSVNQISNNIVASHNRNSGETLKR